MTGPAAHPHRTAPRATCCPVTPQRDALRLKPTDRLQCIAPPTAIPGRRCAKRSDGGRTAAAPAAANELEGSCDRARCMEGLSSAASCRSCRTVPMGAPSLCRAPSAPSQGMLRFRAGAHHCTLCDARHQDGYQRCKSSLPALQELQTACSDAHVVSLGQTFQCDGFPRCSLGE